MYLPVTRSVPTWPEHCIESGKRRRARPRPLALPLPGWGVVGSLSLLLFSLPPRIYYILRNYYVIIV